DVEDRPATDAAYRVTQPVRQAHKRIVCARAAGTAEHRDTAAHAGTQRCGDTGARRVFLDLSQHLAEPRRQHADPAAIETGCPALLAGTLGDSGASRRTRLERSRDAAAGEIAQRRTQPRRVRRFEDDEPMRAKLLFDALALHGNL